MCSLIFAFRVLDVGQQMQYAYVKAGIWSRSLTHRWQPLGLYPHQHELFMPATPFQYCSCGVQSMLSHIGSGNVGRKLGAREFRPSTLDSDWHQFQRHFRPLARFVTFMSRSIAHGQRRNLDINHQSEPMETAQQLILINTNTIS
jgi:hypothetical protein